jgi:flagellar biosynthesis protein FlhG
VVDDSRLPDDLIPQGGEDQLGLPSVGRRARHIVAFGGGKGGVGKSLLTANVGIYLAQLGKRVVLLDGDLGGANLHTFVGVDRPAITLGAFFERRVTAIEDVVVPTKVNNLGLLSGEGEPLGAANPRPAQKNRLIAQARDLDVDYLLVDLPPGSGFTALDFFLMADIGVLVAVPEPTSVENTFRFIKSAFLRRLRSLPGIDALLDADWAAEGGIPTPADLIVAARQKMPQLAGRLEKELRIFRPRLVVNQTRTRADLELGPALRSAGRRRLGLGVGYLGHLETDDAVWLAVRKRRPLVVEHPESKASKNIEKIVRKILAAEGERPFPEGMPRLEHEHNLYEVLEAEPTASEEELRRAYRRVREIYAPESMAVCGLYSLDGLARFAEKLQEAYDTLIDPERRQAYDRATWPEGVPRRRVGTPAAGLAVDALLRSGGRVEELRPVVPEPPLSPETEYTGELLRRVREARGIELEDISNRTKIHIGHLRSIELERFDILPAKVYLRGFVTEYAKALRLEPRLVAKSYLARYDAIAKPDD